MGEWDLASQCVVHIGIVLWYFGMSVGNAGHHSWLVEVSKSCRTPKSEVALVYL